jgi:hypothetical protein
MLPSDATPQSWQRLQIARELTDRCPPVLGQEVAVTGSVALGLADAASDAELNLWVEALPYAAQRDAWLAAIGATDVKAQDMPWGDGTFAATFRYRGMTIEDGHPPSG